MATFNTVFLAGFFTFVAVFYLIRLQMQPTPRQFMGERGSSHWLGHVAFRFFRVLILAVCVLRIFYPQLDVYLGICSYLNQWPLLVIGPVLMVSGFVMTVVGHYTLGSNWTSGIDPEQRRPLVTNGVYSRSRNPMYIGVLATQLGFFLALPSVFTFICLVIGFSAVLNQVRLEERHLSDVISDEYSAYVSRVPRWI